MGAAQRSIGDPRLVAFGVGVTGDIDPIEPRERTQDLFGRGVRALPICAQFSIGVTADLNVSVASL